MATQATYVTSARVDLSDPNPPAALLSDADLDRHVQHAVNEYSYWNPLEVKNTSLLLTTGSRDIDITSIASALIGAGIYAVEYPTGQWPPAYVQFQRYANVLTLFLDGAPLATDVKNVNLYCLQAHTVNNAGSDIPGRDDEAIVAGTVAFAAREIATRLAGQVVAAGPTTWLKYRDLALDKDAEFRGYLQTVRSKVTVQRAYAPEEPKQSRFTVEAPWRD